MVIPHKKGEGIPLSVVESDTRRGTITLIIQEAGGVSEQLGAMRINDTIFGDFQALFINGFSDFFRGGATIADIIFNAKIAIGATGIMAGR